MTIGSRSIARRRFVRLASASVGLAFAAGCGWPITQPTPTKLRRVGVLVSGGAVTQSGPTADNSDRGKWLAFSGSLRSYGWVESQNVQVDWRSWYQHEEILPQLISDLVELPVDVLVTDNTTATLPAEQVTASVPIVFTTAGDPVALGLVHCASCSKRYGYLFESQQPHRKSGRPFARRRSRPGSRRAPVEFEQRR